MTRNIFSDSLSAINENNCINNDTDDYVLVSVRPGDKVSSLIDVLTEMNNNKLPLFKLTDLLSRELAEFSVSRTEHAECVAKVAQNHMWFDPRSALGILQKNGCIKHTPIKFNFKSIKHSAPKEEQ